MGFLVALSPARGGSAQSRCTPPALRPGDVRRRDKTACPGALARHIQSRQPLHCHRSRQTDCSNCSEAALIPGFSEPQNYTTTWTEWLRRKFRPLPAFETGPVSGFESERVVFNKPTRKTME